MQHFATTAHSEIYVTRIQSVKAICIFTAVFMRENMCQQRKNDWNLYNQNGEKNGSEIENKRQRERFTNSRILLNE